MSEAILHTPKAAQEDLRQFYNKYAGMLLGFIQGTVDDPQRSEEYLVKIITSFVLETNSHRGNNLSSWLSLRQYAQRKLEHQNFGKAGALSNGNRVSKHAIENLELLSAQEKTIFQAVYYQGKSISQLAKTFGMTEKNLRIELKSSIDKMRRASGN